MNLRKAYDLPQVTTAARRDVALQNRNRPLGVDGA